VQLLIDVCVFDNLIKYFCYQLHVDLFFFLTSSEDLPCRKKLTCPSWKWHLNRSSWKMQHTTANYTGNQYTFTCYFHFVCFFFILHRLWSYASWINNYLCNQCLLQLTLWFRILLDATLCDTVCQWLVAGRWFSPGTPVSSINKIAPRYN
jgi:hypothetical protein